ncbi:MAG: hypothetical protein CSA68_08600 [Rhodobacterales bacterium]|nr:MAG: hypothetical protein CSA68_08600 [Rhodobacterales bacterium]
MTGAEPRWGGVFGWRVRALARRGGYRLLDRLRPPDPGARIKAAETALRNRPGPVRIGFVVCNPAKWSAGPLFARLARDPAFEVSLHVTLSDVALRLPRAQRREDFRRVSAFFEMIGPLGPPLYDATTDRMQPEAQIGVDLAVIQQPWGMQDLPRRLLKGGILSAYLHYGYPIIRNDGMQFGLPDFHRYLWAYIAASDWHGKMAMSGPAPPYQVIVAGYPKLDIYLSPAPARNAVPHWSHPGQAGRKRVIFAPHHTLDSTLKMGTFDWSGPTMLELVRSYPQVDFLLKPHPNLRAEMHRRGAARAFADWLDAWQAAPNTAQFEAGNYFDLFRSSDLMITDSGSFLAEYLPTGHPILRLCRADSAPMNTAGRALVPAFYTADTADELRRAFERILIRGQDPLAELRSELARRVLPQEGGSAEVVTRYLRCKLASKG